MVRVHPNSMPLSGSGLSVDVWITEFRRDYQANADYSAESFLLENPHWAVDPNIVVQVIYEEYCLRREIGVPITIDELLERHPQWRSKLAVVLECDQILNEQSPDVLLPGPGESIGDFQLHEELGRGALGRVFLATQPSLSDRPLVLKLSPPTGSEHLSLARLQHSAIVPLLFAHDDPQQNVRLLAMPYLGGCTLADAMASMGSIDVRNRTGKEFVHAILQHQRVASPRRVDHPAIRFLASATYEQAVCWIIACLADGLHYAHQRGFAHLDVKPSNVLLAGDGQPMLLDFHLAQPLADLRNDQPVSIGGTPGYMAPEQLRGMQEIISEGAMGGPIDHRCDIFALGLLLHDLLSGAMPPSVQSQEESPSRRLPIAGNLARLGSRPVVRLMQQCLAENPSARGEDTHRIAVLLRRISLGHKSHRDRPQFWRGFILGCLVAVAAITLALPHWRSATPVPNTTGALPVLAEEMEHMLRDAHDMDVVNSAPPAQQQVLLEACRRLLQQSARLTSAVDRCDDQARLQRMVHNLEGLESLSQQLAVKIGENRRSSPEL